MPSSRPVSSNVSRIAAITKRARLRPGLARWVLRMQPRFDLRVEMRIRRHAAVERFDTAAGKHDICLA